MKNLLLFLFALTSCTHKHEQAQVLFNLSLWDKHTGLITEAEELTPLEMKAWSDTATINCQYLVTTIVVMGSEVEQSEEAEFSLELLVRHGRTLFFIRSK